MDQKPAGNFWQKLTKPIMVLAPMYDVTDGAFRQIINKYGKPARPHGSSGAGGPDVFFTEFVSADGLCHPTGREKLLRELYFTPDERPIVAQLFSSRPEKMRQASKLVAELGFDGLDINMGCPDRTIEKQGCGADLIKNPALAGELIRSAKAGITDAGSDIPVSVKTRIGYNQPDLENWTRELLKAEPAVITFHLRTRKEMSLVPAHWELAHIPVEIARGTGTLIIGNGDIETPAEGRAKAQQYGLDGVMIGRGIFGNPWLFAERVPTVEEKLKVLVEHTKLFEEMYRETDTNKKLFHGHTKSFAVMKKHFKAYVSDFPGAPELRAKLMTTNSAPEVEEIVDKHL